MYMGVYGARDWKSREWSCPAVTSLPVSAGLGLSPEVLDSYLTGGT